MPEPSKGVQIAPDSERFRALIDAVTDYAIYMLDIDGYVSSWNAGAERLKGYSESEIIGQHFSKFYLDAERLAGFPARNLRVAAAEGRFEAEGLRVRKDGTTFWANVVIDPIRDEAGEIIGFAKITRDITERREAQIALQKTQGQLAQAQKMEALGHLTGGVAHDFNNLLMIIMGFLPALKDPSTSEAKRLRAAGAIETAAKRGEALTRQLLSFSRRQHLHPTVTQLQERIDAIHPMLSSTLSDRCRLVVVIDPAAWPVRVDANEFELALINLVVNARDAIEQAGSVTVSVENTTLRRGDTPAGLEGEFVAISIADTGCGIPENILPNVFDPFFTTKAATRGSGLGLSQVHGFAHQAGGTVTIRSELGRGTTVTLYLPRVHEEPAAAEPAPDQIVSVHARVLLVEDNPEVATATQDLLERLGCNVRTAGNAETALLSLESAAFDLVLSDLVMPGSMDGLTLARTIRRKFPSLPVLLATGFSDRARQAATEFTVMRKPYELAELSRSVAEAIGQRQSSTASGNVVHLLSVKRDPGSRPGGSSGT